MKQEIHDLIEAVRGLGLKLTGQPAPKCVRITGDTSDFAIRLEQVQRALEILDASGSLSDADELKLDPKNDPEKLRQALDGLIRFIQVKGGSFAEADAIVRDALSLETEAKEKKKGSGTLPTFTPSKLKKKKGGYKLRLNIFPDRPGEASLNDLRKIVFDLSVTQSVLGNTVARPEAAFQRSQTPPAPPIMRRR